MDLLPLDVIPSAGGILINIPFEFTSSATIPTSGCADLNSTTNANVKLLSLTPYQSYLANIETVGPTEGFIYLNNGIYTFTTISPLTNPVIVPAGTLINLLGPATVTFS